VRVSMAATLLGGSEMYMMPSTTMGEVSNFWSELVW
jgi:hypothetical protein